MRFGSPNSGSKQVDDNAIIQSGYDSDRAVMPPALGQPDTAPATTAPVPVP
jgi:hypothetical protein